MHDDEESSATLYAWNDLLLAVFAGCMFLLAAFLIKVNESKPVEDKVTNAETGSIAVYCFWQDNIDADIDIHVLSPEGEHNYYRRMQGRIWSILRDDLGKTGDPGERNFENAATRGLVPGVYYINLHAYRAANNLYPIKVDCEVRVNPRSRSGQQTKPFVILKSVEMLGLGNEQAVVSFSIGSDGTVQADSISHDFESIVRR